MMERRSFLARAAAIVVASCAPHARSAFAAVPRLGVLAVNLRGRNEHLIRAFQQGLHDLGYVEGKTILVEYRSADGKLERLPDLAADLVRSKVDIIVATNPQAIAAAKAATTTIPIVMGLAGDPIGSGFVASLARPGGNITGPSGMSPHVVGKQLEILKEVIPGLSRAAVLWNSAHPTGLPQLREAELVAKGMPLQLITLNVNEPSGIESAFATMRQAKADALLVLVDSMLLTQRARVVNLAARDQLPAMYWAREYVEAGGLMTYSSNMAALLRRAAVYVDRILKGAKPAELPIEQPTKFELVVNLKTAKALGVTIPPSVLLRADEVIQ